MKRTRLDEFGLDLTVDVNYIVWPAVDAKIYGRPEDCSPAEPMEIEILSVKYNGQKLDMIDEDLETLAAVILEKESGEM